MSAARTPSYDAEQARAVCRWKVGHHVFHLQLVAMNSVIDDAFAALRADDARRLAGRLQELRLLYDAATVSMRYAASFRPETYTALIRPSMDEPFTGPGFSGRFNREHAEMLSRLKELKREVRAALESEPEAEDLRAASTELWAAQARNRRNHMFVCQRFVPGGRSLLREYFQRTGSGPGPRPTPSER